MISTSYFRPKIQVTTPDKFKNNERQKFQTGN